MVGSDREIGRPGVPHTAWLALGPLTSRSQLRGRAAACDIAKDVPK